ncbi:MAG: MoxR family ATPase [Planctomycetaceae bacterium]|nr:MoxR family ATPase [Planctomycetaceae bacterium]
MNQPPNNVLETQHDRLALEQLRQRLNQALVGKSDVIEMVLTCLLAKGHLLFDDLPGLGKTTLAKAIANGIGAKFARVQCTPDLLPADITGFNIFDQKDREFRFRPGPIFSDILLTDEINRTTPRTQSALFEAMAERQVTIDSQSMPLSPSFFVIATQNPVESHGAYPLPEAQLDRFTMRLSIGYPDRSFEMEMLARNIMEADESRNGAAAENGPVLSMGQLSRIQRQVAAVPVHEKLRGYLIDLCRETREHRDLPMGISPRGAITWMKCAQAAAYLANRNFVVPEDVQRVAGAVLSLRLSPFSEKPESFVRKLLQLVPVPI